MCTGSTVVQRNMPSKSKLLFSFRMNVSKLFGSVLYASIEFKCCIYSRVPDDRGPIQSNNAEFRKEVKNFHVCTITNPMTIDTFRDLLASGFPPDSRFEIATQKSTS